MNEERYKYSMKLTYRFFHEPQVRELNETKVGGEKKQDSPMKKRNATYNVSTSTIFIHFRIF